MNVLAILQEAAIQIGIPSPSAYNSNTRLLNLLYGVCKELRTTRAFPTQKKSHSFNTVDSTATYALPTDFYSGLLGTQWNQTTHLQLVGPISDAEWNYRLYASSPASSNYLWRVKIGDFNPVTETVLMELNPTPSTEETVSYDYISRNLFVATSGPSTTVKETVGADSDLCVFDSDVVINGLNYRYRESRGLSFSEPKALYKAGIDNAAARWTGSYVGSFGKCNRGRRYGPSTPGNWSF